MATVSIKCPECGASIIVEEGKPSYFCSYCGSSIVVGKADKTIDYNLTYRTIDDARIRESEERERIRMKEIEMQQQEKVKSRKHFAITMLIMIALLVVFSVLESYRSSVPMLERTPSIKMIGNIGDTGLLITIPAILIYLIAYGVKSRNRKR